MHHKRTADTRKMAKAVVHSTRFLLCTSEARENFVARRYLVRPGRVLDPRDGRERMGPIWGLEAEFVSLNCVGQCLLTTVVTAQSSGVTTSATDPISRKIPDI